MPPQLTRMTDEQLLEHYESVCDELKKVTRRGIELRQAQALAAKHMTGRGIKRSHGLSNEFGRKNGKLCIR